MKYVWYENKSDWCQVTKSGFKKQILTQLEGPHNIKCRNLQYLTLQEKLINVLGDQCSTSGGGAVIPWHRFGWDRRIGVTLVAPLFDCSTEYMRHRQHSKYVVDSDDDGYDCFDQAEDNDDNGDDGSGDNNHMKVVSRVQYPLSPYLIIVISLTPTGFSNPKSTFENTQKRVKDAFNLEIFTPDKNCLQKHCWWYLWQLPGVPISWIMYHGVKDWTVLYITGHTQPDAMYWLALQCIAQMIADSQLAMYCIHCNAQTTYIESFCIELHCADDWGHPSHIDCIALNCTAMHCIVQLIGETQLVRLRWRKHW